MEALDYNYTVVTTAAQLASAVGTGSTYDYIYLGDDIQLPFAGITIDPSKPELIIDGLHDNVTHRIIEYASVVSTDCLGIRSTSNIDITLRNLIIEGKNYFGTPYVAEISGTSGVSVTYESVVYQGPQMTYNAYGTTRYVDCDITITSSGLVQPEEVGEVCRVEFDGENVIHHNSTGLLSVFWFRGTVGNASFKLLPEAKLSVTTTNYFMFARTPKAVPLTNCPVDIQLLEGSEFVLDSNRGFGYDDKHLVSSFLVDENASFRYIQHAPHDSYSSMYIQNELNMEPGASFYMQADYDSAAPLITFTEDGGDGINLINPKSFILYNKSNMHINTDSTQITKPFTMQGGQLNQWYQATPFASGAGDIDDEPNDKWNRPDWTAFSIWGNINENVTSVLGTNFTSEELINLPDPEDFSFYSSRVVSFGNLPLTPDPIINTGRPITGKTEPNANVYINYTLEEIPYSFVVIAEPDGSFEVDPATILPEGLQVQIRANTPFLITEKLEGVQDEGEISLVSAPQTIYFVAPGVSLDPVLLKRQTPDQPVEIFDSRPYPTAWVLLAAIAGPLSTQDGDVLENAVVFRDENGDLLTLDNVARPIYDGEAKTGATNVVWPEQQGILIRVTEPMRSKVEYSTELVWELQVT